MLSVCLGQRALMWGGEGWVGVRVPLLHPISLPFVSPPPPHPTSAQPSSATPAGSLTVGAAVLGLVGV